MIQVFPESLHTNWGKCFTHQESQGSTSFLSPDWSTVKRCPCGPAAFVVSSVVGRWSQWYCWIVGSKSNKQIPKQNIYQLSKTCCRGHDIQECCHFWGLKTPWSGPNPSCFHSWVTDAHTHAQVDSLRLPRPTLQPMVLECDDPIPENPFKEQAWWPRKSNE